MTYEETLEGLNQEPNADQAFRESLGYKVIIQPLQIAAL